MTSPEKVWLELTGHFQAAVAHSVGTAIKDRTTVITVITLAVTPKGPDDISVILETRPYSKAMINKLAIGAEDQKAQRERTN